MHAYTVTKLTAYTAQALVPWRSPEARPELDSPPVTTTAATYLTSQVTSPAAVTRSVLLQYTR